MAEGKKIFQLYIDQQELFTQLTNEQAGILIKHIFAYVNDENPTTDDLIINLAFTSIKQQLKRDLKKWKERAQRSRENGAKGGRPRKNLKNPEGFLKTQKNPEEPRKPDKVTDTVKVKDTVTDNNKRESKDSLGGRKKKFKIDYEEIKRIFNSVCVELPQVKSLSAARKTAIRMRVKEHGLESVGDVFRKIQASDFLNGANSSNWKANFDWVFKANNYIKILEDNYINKTKNEKRDIKKRTGVSEDFLNSLR